MSWALMWLLQAALPPTLRVVVHPDNMSVVDITQGEAATAKPCMLCRAMVALRVLLQSVRPVYVQLIHAHVGHPWNELSDVMAKRKNDERSEEVFLPFQAKSWLRATVADPLWP